MSGGYIVTVKRRVGDVDSQGICEPDPVAVVSRQEVDTLEDADQLVWGMCRASLPAGTEHREVVELYRRVVNGGMGTEPLPDGSTITVERKDGEGR